MSNWTAEQRAYAKETQRTLCAVAIDGRHVKSAATGSYVQAGPLPDHLARKIFFFAAKVWQDWEMSLDEGVEKNVEARIDRKKPAKKKATR